jgi:hypothetical protein
VPNQTTSLDSGSYRLRSPNFPVINSRDPTNHLKPGTNFVVDRNAIALTKHDLVSPTVGAMCHGFTTGFESRGAHGCKEQWNTRDTWV